MIKWMIASDIHGSAYYCERLMAAYRLEAPGRVALLGDLLYHGPRNDLPRDYAPKKVIEMLGRLSPAPLCVRGNCEAEVDQMVLGFPVLADYALMALGDRLVYLIHGHRSVPDALLARGDVLLSGHTHVPAWEARDGVWRLNPGSVSLPKEGAPHGYMTLQGTEFVWKDLDGRVYHRLDAHL